MIHSSQRLRSRTAVVFGCLVAIVAALVVAPASATPSTAVTFTLLRNGPPDRTPTTWTATGAVSDSGTWTIDRFVCGACPAPITGAFQFDTTLTSTAGTIEMQLRNVFNQSTDLTLWEIVGGTGSYASLRGHGTYSVWIDGSGVRHIVCEGEAHSM